jgi:thiamine monophosphate synthase
MTHTYYTQALGHRKALKVIAGIQNTDLQQVMSICRAAAQGGAHAVDIAADPHIVASVVALNLPLSVVVSSLNPAELAEAARLGADVLELGNFDAVYDQGDFYSYDDVVELTKDVLALCPSTPLCVTIPGHLSTTAQQSLAKKLTEMGVAMLQTEGAVRVIDRRNVKALEANDKVALTLHNTRAIDQVTHLPVITASGLTPTHLMNAFLAGASGVGIGAYVRQSTDQVEAVKSILSSIPQLSALALAS